MVKDCFDPSKNPCPLKPLLESIHYCQTSLSNLMSSTHTHTHTPCVDQSWIPLYNWYTSSSIQDTGWMITRHSFHEVSAHFCKLHWLKLPQSRRPCMASRCTTLCCVAMHCAIPKGRFTVTHHWPLLSSGHMSAETYWVSPPVQTDLYRKYHHGPSGPAKRYLCLSCFSQCLSVQYIHSLQMYSPHTQIQHRKVYKYASVSHNGSLLVRFTLQPNSLRLNTPQSHDCLITALCHKLILALRTLQTFLWVTAMTSFSIG